MEDLNNLVDFIESLDLGYHYYREGDMYVIPIDNSNDFSDIFTKLKAKDLDLDEQIMLEDTSKFIFTDGAYEIFITANYEKDIYDASIGER